MNIERFKTVVDYIKEKGCTSRFVEIAQIFSGKPICRLSMRRDVREWLDLSMMEEAYLFAFHRTIKDFDTVIEYGGVYGADGYSTDGFDTQGYLCQSGLHACRDPFDALKYAPGPVLFLVERAGGGGNE